MMPTRIATILTISIVMLVAAYVPVQVIAQAGIEAKYVELSKTILNTLREKNIKSTGVLKFSVRIGDGDFPSSVGALNMRLAEKLEVALVLANPAAVKDADQLVGICRESSDVADSIDGANHLTEEGRKALFSKEYPLAFKLADEESLVPDAFIVGAAQIAEDLNSMDVELVLVKKSDCSIEPLASFTVATDLEDLMDAGESFSTRGIFFGGSNISLSMQNKVDLVKKNAKQVRTSISSSQALANSRFHPLAAASDTPVKLEIRYNNVVQNIEFRDGAAFVKEPQQGQKVNFVVRRTGSDKSRYGVLLKVNGENTLYRERKPDAKSSVWILRPDVQAFSVNGFQIDKEKRQEFVVLSDKESENRAMSYGRDVGTINFVLYRESDGGGIALDEEKELRDVQSLVVLPKKTIESRSKIATSLFSQLASQNGTRGLIVEGSETASKIKTETFKRDMTPILAGSIRYYGDEQP